MSQANALQTATQEIPNPSIALANLRLNLHETLTSRVAKKSDILATIAAQAASLSNSGNVGPTRISRTLLSPKPDQGLITLVHRRTAVNGISFAQKAGPEPNLSIPNQP